MNESFGRYETACKGKRKFKVASEARKAAKKLRKRVGSKVRPYKCGHCGFIHNGHLRYGLDATKQMKQNQSTEKY